MYSVKYLIITIIKFCIGLRGYYGKSICWQNIREIRENSRKIGRTDSCVRICAEIECLGTVGKDSNFSVSETVERFHFMMQIWSIRLFCLAEGRIWRKKILLIRGWSMLILWKIGERNSLKSVDDWKCRYIIGLLCAGSRSVYENIGAICSKLKNPDWISSQAAAQCFNFSFSSSAYFYSHFFIVFFLQNIISVPVFYGGCFHSANFTNRFLECRWEESWIQITGMI